MGLIRQGDKGREVEAWQRALIDLGYNLDPWGADGDFGEGTHLATVNLQRDLSLVVDGIVGPATWAASVASDEVETYEANKDAVSSAPLNCLIVGGEAVELPRVDIKNWHQPGVFHFKNSLRAQAQPVTKIVIHESTSRSREDTMRGWQRPRQGSSSPYYIGIHGCFEADGSVHWHNDPAKDRLIHGGPHNDSIGLEIYNPYYPAWNRVSKWPFTIDAPWADRGPTRDKPPRYVLPLQPQLEALSRVVRALTSQKRDLIGVDVPRQWIGLAGDKLSFTRVAGASGPGIYAHGNYAHADGWFPVLYCVLRLEAKLDEHEAYQTAIDLATGARGSVDLSKYL